jgi:hypothetical protein
MEDLFICTALVMMCIYKAIDEAGNSDWWGVFGFMLPVVVSGFFIAARIYHLTHKDEVFGKVQESKHG